jgi:hypothetical protein
MLDVIFDQKKKEPGEAATLHLFILPFFKNKLLRVVPCIIC